MKVYLWTLLIACAALLFVGCEKEKSEEEAKSGPSTEELAAECEALTSQLGGDADMMEILAKSIDTCGTACEKGADDSCIELDGVMDTLCGVAPDICGEMCKTLETPATKDAACRYAPTE